MGREGELCRGPQGHRAGHPREGGLLCCQGALKREAAFRAQHEKAWVKAGESHCCGTHLGLPPGRLWREEQQGRAEGSRSRCPQGAQARAWTLWPSVAPTCLPPGSLAQGSHSLGLPRGPVSRAAASPLRTFFSLVLLGSCCTARAKPALSCSRPAPTASQSSTFPSVATLSTWKRWPCWGPGSQTTWTTGCGAELRKDACPTSQQDQVSLSPLPFSSRETSAGRPGSRLTHQRVPRSPQSQQKTRTVGTAALMEGAGVTHGLGAPRMPETAVQLPTPW